MTFVSRRAKLDLSSSDYKILTRISRSRVESAIRILRANIVLRYHAGQTVSAIARQMGIDRPRVDLAVSKALSLGALASLDDLARSGKPAVIAAEAKAWLVSLACAKPVELGYSYELWTMSLLAKHARNHCRAAGHPSLATLVKSTVSKILSANEIKPHKIRYYLERRDPKFDEKMAQVLYVYKEVSIWRENGLPDYLAAVVSYDEKPGIQAIGNTAPDLAPAPGKHPCVSRDHEYVRHGTVSLLGGIDLLTGEVLGLVRERHRSAEFIEFLSLCDSRYKEQAKIRIILDNHSAHASKEVMEYLKLKPNRFEFVFTPKHGSWLNLVEGFFAKMTNTMLRGIRVSSKEELMHRIELYLAEVNAAPVVFRWKYKLEDIQIA